MVSFTAKKIITRRLPILQWLPHYDLTKFLFDLIAGITVGLMVMPQSLANADLAGMEPEYGLYAAFVGGFVYAVLGTNKCVTIGSEAVICVMTFQQIKGKSTDYAILLSFLTGAVQLLMFVFRLDVLMDFFSVPVIAGYVSASSIIIGSSQLKNLLGLDVNSSGFVDDIVTVFENVEDIRYVDLALGALCIVILICLRQLQLLKIKSSDGIPIDCKWNNACTILSNSRNILVVMTCAVIAYLYETQGDGSPFTLTGKVQAGLPSFKVPPFSTMDEKTGDTVPLVNMLSDLGASIVLVPVVSALTNIAIVKSFAINGKVDGSQELFSIGMINVIGSFFSSMPVTASFSRSAVNESSGVKTQAGGIVTSALVLLTLAFLTPLLFYIPRTSLAALIISAIIFMMELEVVKPIWRSNKGDFVTLVVTFFGCLLLQIQYGILLGVVANSIFLLFSAARPTVTIDIKMNQAGSEYMMITPKSSLYFPSVDYVNSKIGKAVTSTQVMPVVINCEYVIDTDFTAATGISYLMEEFIQRNQPLYFVNTPDNVISVLQNILKGNFNNFNSIEDFEASLQDDLVIVTGKYQRKKSSFLFRKFSVPLESVISIDDKHKRRYSCINR